MRYVRARVSDEAYTGFDRMCDEQGVTLAGYLQALGEWLAESSEFTEAGQGVIRRAREVDRERRSRRDRLGEGLEE